MTSFCKADKQDDLILGAVTNEVLIRVINFNNLSNKISFEWLLIDFRDISLEYINNDLFLVVNKGKTIQKHLIAFILNADSEVRQELINAFMFIFKGARYCDNIKELFKGNDKRLNYTVDLFKAYIMDISQKNPKLKDIDLKYIDKAFKQLAKI